MVWPDNRRGVAWIVLATAVAVLMGMRLEAGETPSAIPTFHCLGLYWSPKNGSAEKQVQVRYRQQGQPQWKDALPMRYYPIPKTDLALADYRGSIVNLTSGTSYEVQLTLSGSSLTETLVARTWSDAF